MVQRVNFGPYLGMVALEMFECVLLTGRDAGCKWREWGDMKSQTYSVCKLRSFIAVDVFMCSRNSTDEYLSELVLVMWVMKVEEGGRGCDFEETPSGARVDV